MTLEENVVQMRHYVKNWNVCQNSFFNLFFYIQDFWLEEAPLFRVNGVAFLGWLG